VPGVANQRIANYPELACGAQAPFPAVSDPQPAVKELVEFPPRNLEADHAFARENGLVASTAFDSCCAFLVHKSPLLELALRISRCLRGTLRQR